MRGNVIRSEAELDDFRERLRREETRLVDYRAELERLVSLRTTWSAPSNLSMLS